MYEAKPGASDKCVPLEEGRGGELGSALQWSTRILIRDGNFHFQEVESDFPTSKLPEKLGSNTFEGSTSVQLPSHFHSNNYRLRAKNK